MSTPNREEARISRLAFRYMIAACAVSLVYQLYRARVGESERWDTFGVFELGFYASIVLLSALSRAERPLARWLAVLLPAALIAVGTFFYLPVIAMSRTMGLIDWAEAVAYLCFLAVALFLSSLRLRGRAIVIV